MASHTEQLNNLLEKMVVEKTLSLDGLHGLQQLTATVAAQDKEIETLKTRVESQKNSIQELEHRNGQLTKERDALKAAEEAMAARERKVFELEKTAAVHSAIASTYRDSMAIVFAPNSVRERVVAMSGHSLPNGQYSNQNEDSNRTLTQGYAHPDEAGKPKKDRSGNVESL